VDVWEREGGRIGGRGSVARGRKKGRVWAPRRVVGMKERDKG
jgi:hypothetical protein